MHYRITVDGNVGARLAQVFPHLTTTAEHPYHVISGDIRDQSQLHGVLGLIRDLNIVLVSVVRIQEFVDEPEGPGEAQP